MNFLILGGTVFLGRHIVEQALQRGHEVTLFNRGRTNPDLFPGVERIVGDRREPLDALAGRRWDAVIDTSGYLPADVRRSAQTLAEGVDRYCFISSISVYSDYAQNRLDEQSALQRLDAPESTELSGESYGALKVHCEEAAEGALPGRTLIIRPGLIVGPDDPTDRFGYWVERVADGGELLAPGDPTQPVQWIDVRDLAAWVVEALARGVTGTFNATGPASPLTMGDFLRQLRDTLESDAAFTWVTEAFLQAQGVAAWTELPLWLPSAASGIHRVAIQRALDAGLALRPAAETIRDSAAWLATLPAERPRRAGLARVREWELLQAWHAQEGHLNSA